MDRIREILALLDTPEQLTNAQIAELHAELLELFDGVRDGSIELADDTTVLDECRSIAEAASNLGALAHQRMEAELAEQAELDSLAATLHPEPVADPEEIPEPDPVPEPETVPEPVDAVDPPEAPETPPEPVEETEPEPVAAGASPASRPPLGAAAARQPARTRPRPEVTRPEPTVVVSAANGGVIEPSDIGRVMSRGFRELGPNAGKRTLVTITGQYDEAHRMDETDEAGNGRKLSAIAASAQEPGAFDELPITAAGLGWCTPSQVNYDEVVQSLANRPATAALPTVGIDRGGVRVPVSPTLADINTALDLTDATPDDTAVTVFTEQNDIDIDPNDDATLKPIQKITCPTWVEFRTYAIVKRLRFDNFAARTNPENVDAWNTLAAAAYARVAETRVLDLIKTDTGTTNITETTTLLGSARDFVEMVLRLVEFMRNAERATDGSGGGPTIRLLAPSWSVALNQADLVRTFRDFDGPNNNLVVPRTDIVEMLRTAGVNPTFYIDSPSTGPTQLLGKQTDNGVPKNWPCDIQYGLWFEGHFAHGDEGELNLGVVRDSTLNAQNDYETFVESFETVIARRGPEALWVTQKLVADGAYAASVDISGDVSCS